MHRLFFFPLLRVRSVFFKQFYLFLTKGILFIKIRTLFSRADEPLYEPPFRNLFVMSG